MRDSARGMPPRIDQIREMIDIERQNVVRRDIKKDNCLHLIFILISFKFDITFFKLSY